MAFDWDAIIAARRRAKSIIEGVTVVGDPLDSPPAPGAERSWLAQLLDDAKGLLAKIAAKAQTQKQEAAEAAKHLKEALDHAGEAAKTHAKDFLHGFSQAAAETLKFGGFASVAMTAFFLWLAYRLASDIFGKQRA